MMYFSDLMSGRFALLGITWMASGLGAVHQHSCRILRRGNAAVLRIIPIVMKTVTMKMLAARSIQEVGANASGQVITWPASTRATAMIFIACYNYYTWYSLSTFWLAKSLLLVLRIHVIFWTSVIIVYCGIPILEPPGKTQVGLRNREFEKSKVASNYA